MRCEGDTLDRYKRLIELYVNVGDAASGGVLFVEDIALNTVPKFDTSNELWQLILTA